MIPWFSSQVVSAQESPIGLIAGSGDLPLILARAVRENGNCPVVAVAHLHETNPGLASLVQKIEWVRLGQFKRIIRFLANHKVKQVVLAGGIAKPSIWHIRPDLLALKLAWQLPHLQDDLLLRGVAELLETHGFSVRAVSDFVPELCAPAGLCSHRKPSPEQWADIQLGWQTAKQLGQLDIGQGVVVHQKVIVAMEAVEGTDAMIARAGSLLQGHGGVLVKVCKPMQDKRLDLPTIGPRTIENLHQAGISVVAVESGSTLILDPQVTLSTANRLHIALITCSAEDLFGSSHSLEIVANPR